MWKLTKKVLMLRPDCVTPPERLVLVALADHADADGTNAWPSQGTLAAMTSLCVRSVRAALSALVAKKLIIREKAKTRHGVRRYRFNLDRLEHWKRVAADADTGRQEMPTGNSCRPAGDADRQEVPTIVDRQELPVRSAGAADVGRQELPVTSAGAADDPVLIQSVDPKRDPERKKRAPSSRTRDPDEDLARAVEDGNDGLRNVHRDHLLCDVQSRSYCIVRQVHEGLISDLLDRRAFADRATASRALLGWYESVWREIPPLSVLGDRFNFWRPWLDATWPRRRRLRAVGGRRR